MSVVSADNVVVLIMAGGVGSRLWPISTESKPKQFCHLASTDKTMIQSIYDLSRLLVEDDRIYVSTNTDYVPLVVEQLPSLSRQNIIVEPFPAGTTASIALSTVQIKISHPDAVVVVVSSDCVIEGESKFLEAIQSAIDVSGSEMTLVSVGVSPTEPHTGYGYMKCGSEVAQRCYEGLAYIEKPTKDRAVTLLDEGGYLWNAGIFVWRVDAILEAISLYVAHSRSYLSELEIVLSADLSDLTGVSRVYRKFESSPIDCAVMEKITPDSEVVNRFVEGEFYWSDLGNYVSWKDFLTEDRNGNSVAGNVVVSGVDAARNCILICEEPYRIKVADLQSMIVSVCGNGNLLILPVSEDQNVKSLFDHGAGCSLKVEVQPNSAGGRFKSVLNRVSDGSFSVDENIEVRAAHLEHVNVVISKNEVRVNC